MPKNKNAKGFGKAILIKEEKVNVTPAVTQGDYLADIAKQKLGKKSDRVTQNNNSQGKDDNNYTGVAVRENNDNDNDDETADKTPFLEGFDPSQLQQMINNAVASAIAPIQQQLTDSQTAHQQEVTELNQQLQTQQEQHQTELQQAQSALAEAQSQLEEAQQSNQTSQTELQQLAETVKTAQETIDRFNSLYQLSGSKVPQGVPEGNNMDAPNVNRYTSANGYKLEGTIAEFHQIYDSLPKAQKNDSRGNVFYACDPRELDAYVKQNRSHVILDLQSYGRKHGLFQGNTSRIVTQAATTIGDIPGGFLPVLSSLMRLTHRPGYIFHQFIDTRIEFDKMMGNTVQVYRAGYQPRPSNPNDRQLSGGGTFARISNDGQNIQTGAVPVVIEEWGLGKDGVSQPVEIPSFIRAYSMIELMQILERNLVFDYYSWEDLKIRSLWAPTTRVIYNNSYQVTADPLQLVADSWGTMQKGFLTNLFGYMQDQQIPTLPDGCYGLAVPTKAATQLKNDLDKFWKPATPEQLQDFSNMMMLDSYGESPRVTGYLGNYCDFHIFQTNAYGTGVPGTEGVQTETLGVGAATTRSSYAFGSNTIGRGIGTAMEIRSDNNDDFGRLNRYIWRSEEGFAPLDVDPVGYSDTSAVPQQLRVLEVRTVDNEI